MMVLGVRMRPAPPANPYPTISAWPCTTCTGNTYKIRLATSQVVDSLVDTHQRGTAASVDGLTGALEIEKVGDTICHDGDAIARGAIRGGSLRVSHGDLLVVCALRETRYSSENSGDIPLTNEPTKTQVLEPWRASIGIPATSIGVSHHPPNLAPSELTVFSGFIGDFQQDPLLGINGICLCLGHPKELWSHQQPIEKAPVFPREPTFASNAATSSLMKCAPLKLN